jgi:hypothetical protein
MVAFHAELSATTGAGYATPVRVAVYSLAGLFLEVAVDRECTVRGLKERIAAQVQLPLECQSLIDAGAAVLDDSSSLLGNLPAIGEQATESELSVTLVKHIEVLYDGIAAAHPDEGPKALELLPQVVSRGDERAVEAVTACLGHARDYMRRAAMSTLPRVAPQGDAGAIAAVRQGLQSTDTPLRLAAVQALPRITSELDESTLALLTQCKRRDRCGLVRLAADEAFRQLSCL